MPVQCHQPYRWSSNNGGMHSPDEYGRNETCDDPGIHDHQTGHNYHPDSLPSGDYAFDAWPPSIYEAAQYAYPGFLPYRQPTNPPFEPTVHPVGESYDSVGGSDSAIDDAGPSTFDHGRGHGGLKPKSANKKTSLRCLVCVEKPLFTGQYAQRNLNRHMEKHKACTGARSNRHIRCGQPGCASTFGREDALLVHLRRSHPELNTPPAKKRKRED